MNAQSIRKLLLEVRRGKVSPDEAVDRLRHMPFEDLGFAKVDHHRALRAGMPEVVLAEGKTPQQVALHLRAAGAARRQRAGHARLREALRGGAQVGAQGGVSRAGACHRAAARPHEATARERSPWSRAGTSDIPVAEEAVVTAEVMGNDVEHLYDVGVAGIHRLLAHRAGARQRRAW